MKMKTVIIAILLTTSAGTHSAVQSDDEKSIDAFLKAETAEARNMVSGFSNQLIETYSENYKANLSAKESRKLWILEEGYKRKADKVAADRLFYVFLAVGLLACLIFFLTFRIYQMQKNLVRGRTE